MATTDFVADATPATQTPDEPNFVHLHVHSEYSMLDGLGRIKDIANTAKKMGQPAVAITDHGNLSGAFAFRKACLDAGVKPILGVELYLALGSRFAPEEIEVARDDDTAADSDEEETGKRFKKDTKTKRNEHLTVLARTGEGWTNLVQIMNAAQETFWHKPLADYELLTQHGAGLIVLTGCLGGPVAGPVSRGDFVTARKNIQNLIEAVGRENVYVEIMEHGIELEKDNLKGLKKLATEFGLPMVVTNDCHYVHAEDESAHEAWLAIQSKKTLDDPNRFHFHGGGYHLADAAYMRAVHPSPTWQDACDNTVALAERISDDVIGDTGINLRLPKFPLPDGFATADKYLMHLTTEGGKKRYDFPFNAEVKARLRHEFNVISGAGLSDYLLIVHDLVDWANSDRGFPTAEFPDGEPGQKLPILSGYGRGSAAGSALSYCLHIVGIDPIEMGLLFERFLEPGRVGMPDIDLDFETDRRDEILTYVQIRYGTDFVARIGTVGKSLSRRAIKDAARILGFPSLGNMLSKAIPVKMGKPSSFAKLADPQEGASESFRKAVKKGGEDAERVVELAMSFEGVVNGESIHACGTIISDAPLNGLVPMRYERKKLDAPRVSMWDGENVEKFGLLKMDILGLRNLDMVSAAIGYIKQTTDEQLNMFTIPHPNTVGDPRVDAAWDLLCAGRTSGIFQMESDGMRKLSEDVAPRSLQELSAVVALYRPGALSANSHTRYIERKHGREKVDYTKYTSDPAEAAAIDTILGETQGVFVYQEQLMFLGTVISGFDTAQRSDLRKAVGKKIESLMIEVGKGFLDGATQEFLAEDGTVISQKFSRDTAEKVWKDMQGSADYLFNKSHSAAYAQLAYVTAFLKANWPIEYGAAVLSVTGKGDKRMLVLDSLREDGITVLAPDVNRSGNGTTPDNNEVLLGLSEIKGVGSVAKWLVAEREANGVFTSLADLLIRVKTPADKPKEDTPGAAEILANWVDEDHLTKSMGLGTAEALIEAGACDQFGPRLGQIIAMRTLRERPGTAIPDANWGVIETSSRQRAALGVALDATNPLIVLADQMDVWKRDDAEAMGLDSLVPKPLPLHEVVDTQGWNSSTLTFGVLSRWEQGSYNKGVRISFSIEGTKTSMDGTIWNDEAVNILEEFGTPILGSIVVISGRVQSREISIEKTEIDEEGRESTRIESFVKRELTASRLWLPEFDDPTRINLAVAPILQAPVAIRPVAVKAVAAAPVVKPTIVREAPEVLAVVVPIKPVGPIVVPAPLPKPPVVEPEEVDTDGPTLMAFRYCWKRPGVWLQGKTALKTLIPSDIETMEPGIYRLTVNDDLVYLCIDEDPQSVQVSDFAAVVEDRDCWTEIEDYAPWEVFTEIQRTSAISAA